MSDKIDAFRADALTRALDVYRSGLVALTAKCESPLEEALLWALLESWEAGGFFPDTLLNASDAFIMGPGVGECEHAHRVIYAQYMLVPQLEVEAPGCRYRIDLALSARRRWPDETQRDTWIAIECDGHDFHERTKEQAERDKRRDRELQALGYLVARFTGSEIHRDPAECAASVYRLLNTTWVSAWSARRAARELERQQKETT